MLKISEGKPIGQTVLLQLDGNLVGPWVSELEQVCDSLLSPGRKVKLHLVGVDFVDSAGVTLLTRLRGRGVVLVECSTFVEAQLQAAARS